MLLVLQPQSSALGALLLLLLHPGQAPSPLDWGAGSPESEGNTPLLPDGGRVELPPISSRGGATLLFTDSVDEPPWGVG